MVSMKSTMFLMLIIFGGNKEVNPPIEFEPAKLTWAIASATQGEQYTIANPRFRQSASERIRSALSIYPQRMIDRLVDRVFVFGQPIPESRRFPRVSRIIVIVDRTDASVDQQLHAQMARFAFFSSVPNINMQWRGFNPTGWKYLEEIESSRSLLANEESEKAFVNEEAKSSWHEDVIQTLACFLSQRSLFAEQARTSPTLSKKLELVEQYWKVVQHKFAATDNSDSNSVSELITDLRLRFGVKVVVVPSDVALVFGGRKCESSTPAQLKKALPLIQHFLESHPESVIRDHLDCIVLYGSFENKAGFYNTRTIGVRTDADTLVQSPFRVFELTLNHELSSAIERSNPGTLTRWVDRFDPDKRLYLCGISDDGKIPPEAIARSLNMSREGLLRSGFVSSAAALTADNDLSEVFSFLVVHPEALVAAGQENSIIRMKAAFVSDLLLSVSADYKPRVDRFRQQVNEPKRGG